MLLDDRDIFTIFVAIKDYKMCLCCCNWTVVMLQYADMEVKGRV